MNRLLATLSPPGLFVFVYVVFVALVACGDDAAGGQSRVDRAEVAALLDGVVFEGGELRAGDIPAATSRARLAPSQSDRLSLAPGDALILPLSLVPDEDDADALIGATLLQFEGTSSHIRVEEDEPTAEARVRGMVTPDLCAVLCNTLYEVDLFVAPELEGGKVGRRSPIAIVLDCSEEGREAECTGSEALVRMSDGRFPDGGAGDGGAASSAFNLAPVAEAGDPLTVDAGGAVQLEGEASDDDGEVVEVEWTQVGGPGVELSVDGVAAEFVAPDVVVATSLTFRFTATDDMGARDFDDVTVTVLPNPEPPTLSAGMDQRVSEGEVVMLEGTGSSSRGAALAGQWEQRSGPQVTLGGSGDAVSFTAPTVSEPTVLTFAYVVIGSDGRVDERIVAVTILPVNQAPTVSAGGDIEANEGDTVRITGTASDPDDDLAGTQWRQIGGPAVSLGGADTLTVSFDAPTVQRPTSVVLELLVIDAEGARESDVVVVTVLPLNTPPSADAGVSRSVEEGTSVVLDGSASDADGTLASVVWRQLAGPVVTLDDAGILMPSFTAPDVTFPATLRFELTVVDDEGAVASDTIEIVVTPPVGANLPPEAYAGPDQIVASGSAVTLAGVEDDSDGSVTSRAWTQVAGPSVGALQNADTLSPSFTAPLTGCAETLVFELMLQDDLGAISTDRVAVIVRQGAPSAPAPPRVFDFDAGDGGLTTGGALFAYGVPTSGPNRAHSGSRVWATNLAGNYVNDANEWLCLPTVDRSGVAALTLSFRLWNRSSATDGLRVQALDPGQGWVDLPAALPPYDDGQRWLSQGYQDRYALLAVEVPPWAGDLPQLRFLFTSSSSGLDLGAYLDDVRFDDEASDPDADGLPGVIAELTGYGTDPFVGDADGDGELDGDEVAAGSDPLDPAVDSGTPPLAPGFLLDFEQSDGGLATRGTLFEDGTPQSGPGRAYSGSRAWATDLDADYFNDAREYLYMPPLDLTSSQDPTLSFRLWSNSSTGDGLRLEVYDAALGWLTLSPLSPPYDDVDASGLPVFRAVGYQNQYRMIAASLADYAGQVVRVRFAFHSNGSGRAMGAFLDDIRLDDEADDPDGDGLAGVLSELIAYGTDPYVADSDGDQESDGDEVGAGSDPRNPAETSGVAALVPGDYLDLDNDTGGLATDGTLWQYGTVAAGPGVAHSGLRAWGTNLGADYDNNVEEYLYLPPIDLSAGGDATLSFRLWSRASVGDGLSLEVRDPSLGWQALAVQAPAYDGTDPSGAPALLNHGYMSRYAFVVASLAALSGQRVYVRFAFRSNSSARVEGAYIDEVAISLESSDPDADGLPGVRDEFLAHGTDPYVADSDGDGALDGDEVTFDGTNPLVGSDYAGGPVWSPGTSDDLEASAGGLTTDGDTFAYGAPASGPAAAHTGSRVWATVLSADYLNGVDEYLYLPPLDLSAVGSASVSFWLWCESAAGDGLSIEVLDDASTWAPVSSVTPPYDATDALGLSAYAVQGSGTGAGASYQLVEAALDAFTGAGSERRLVRLAFRSNTSARAAGCYLDDFALD